MHHTELEYQYYIGQEVIAKEEHKAELRYYRKILTIVNNFIDEEGTLKLSFGKTFLRWFPAEYFIPLNEARKLESRKKIDTLPQNQLIEAMAEAIFQSEQKEKK